MSAADTFATLIQHLRAFRGGEPEHKPFFWLGAGCSVHDGVPLNKDLLATALPAGTSGWGSPQYRWDRFCDALGPGAARMAYLKPYIERDIRPDSPYHHLVRLLVDGYVDTVFSVNIDDLVEQALHAAGLTEGVDYLVVRVPALKPGPAVAMISGRSGPRIRLVKLHGDHRGGFNLMTSSEIVQYDSTIERVVHDHSSRSAIVCGYSFFHLNVLQAFSSTGGPLFHVGPEFPDMPMVLSLMATRNRRDPLFIDGAEGTFARFMGDLARELP